MIRLLLWWLAVLSASGELALMEYRSERSCKIVEYAYHYAHVTTTTCQWR